MRLSTSARASAVSDLIDRLQDENTPWPPGDPLYMKLRKEAAAEIARLMAEDEEWNRPWYFPSTSGAK